jgi:phosphoglycolate phosphatase-like HAD superfamily hydrolase
MRLIVFDIDGTLLLNGRVTRDTFERCFEEVAGFAPRGDRFSFAGMTDRGIFRRMLESEGRADEFDELFPSFAERFPVALASVYPTAEGPYTLPGAPELVEALASRSDVALAVATGNIRASAKVKLSRFGLDRHFPVGAFGGDHETRTELFAACLDGAREHYGQSFDPGESWVIGDTLSDVEAARDVGMRSLAVATGPSGDAELHGADAVFTDLQDTDRVLTVLEA